MCLLDEIKMLIESFFTKELNPKMTIEKFVYNVVYILSDRIIVKLQLYLNLHIFASILNKRILV